MKELLITSIVVATLSAAAGTANAQDVLTGDTRLACEAILCLSTGSRPSECSPSLSRYFGITKRKLSDTLKARFKFLELCPVANQTPEMSALVRGISRGAGRCDAPSLNRTLRSWTGGDGGDIYIDNRMPSYCSAYAGHTYIDLDGTQPLYVGTPERDGYWVEAKEYDRALAEYNARQEEQTRNYWWGEG